MIMSVYGEPWKPEGNIYLDVGRFDRGKFEGEEYEYILYLQVSVWRICETSAGAT